MSQRRARLGRTGEEIAEKYLQTQGYDILHRRYRGARHEIDLVARVRQTIVFVEVKTDTSGSFGSPETWVTPRKQHAIIRAARAFVAAESLVGVDYRFDVVGVTLRPAQPPRITHIQAAFVADS